MEIQSNFVLDLPQNMKKNFVRFACFVFFPTVCVFLLWQDEDSTSAAQDDFTNIATIECANQNGDVIIPVDSRRKNYIEPDRSLR